MGTAQVNVRNTVEQAGGRPTSFRMEMLPKVRQLAKIGATDREIAELLGISSPTFYEWLSRYPKFSSALKQGEKQQTKRVKRALYHRAVGYSQTSEKVAVYQGEAQVIPYVEHIAPDVNAIKFWLTNRDPENWQDRSAVDVTGNLSLVAQTISSARQRALAAKSSPPILDADMDTKAESQEPE